MSRIDDGQVEGVDGGDMVAPGGDLARLQRDLEMARRELAHVRQQQEPLAERVALLGKLRVERDTMARTLARHLSRPCMDVLQVGGWRGRLARRLVRGQFQRAGEGDPLVVLIEQSEWFDASWYLRNNIDVADAGERPAVHYLYCGGKEGRAAGPRFDSAFYMARYPDVGQSGINPLVHFIQIGQAEGRLPQGPAFPSPVDPAV